MYAGGHAGEPDSTLPPPRLADGQAAAIEEFGGTYMGGGDYLKGVEQIRLRPRQVDVAVRGGF